MARKMSRVRRAYRRYKARRAGRRSGGLSFDSVARGTATVAGGMILLGGPVINALNNGGGFASKAAVFRDQLLAQPPERYFEAAAPIITAEAAIGVRKIVKRLGNRVFTAG